MPKVITSEFFDRPTLIVAEELLGKFLVRKMEDGEDCAFMITEVEAYDGPHDGAAHSSRGRTARTEVLFGPAGIWYIYLIYGIHEMLNVVTKGDGAAVLIRGVEGFNGPGKLTKRLGITRALNAQRAAPASGLWIEDRGTALPKGAIKRTPRIGVAYAGEWAKKEWRFVMC